jgi:diguanylate cyclase (GGDEF)-like protein
MSHKPRQELPAEMAATPFATFDDAVRAVLGLIAERTRLELVMLTRVDGDEWKVLAATDSFYGVRGGDVFRWSHSYCARMVAGEGPQCTADAASIETYRKAKINRGLEIGAYIGIPIERADGSLFGTICALSPTRRGDELQASMSLVRVMAGLLATVLDRDLQLEQARRARERAEAEAMVDELTGLYNRRGWRHLLAAEDERCARYGHPAGVIIIDLDGLKEINDSQGHACGDALLRQAANVLRLQCRQSDVLARLGGDEFAVIAVELQESELVALTGRLEQALADAGVEASVGHAVRDLQAGLTAAVARADATMYEHKNQRRQSGR